MITHLSVRDYQSLQHVDLSLAPFTVIVGPSSSGKSALVRALRTLTSNTRGSSFVSTWAKRAVIAADFSDSRDPEDMRGTVTLTRGAKTEDNSYVIMPPVGTPGDPDPDTYTKLGGEVPAEVTRFLGIKPNDTLHFASQFDKPYLLADSPAEVARSFAALTNVHVVFAAAREANRTRLNQSQLLKTRTGDLDAINARKPEFQTLARQRHWLAKAEEQIARAVQIENTAHALTQALHALQTAEETIERTSAAATRPIPSLDDVERLHHEIKTLDTLRQTLCEAEERMALTAPVLARTMPTLTRVEQAHAALTEFKNAIATLQSTTLHVRQSQAYHEETDQALTLAQAEYTTALAAMGTCPTCGQGTAGLTHAEEH